MTDEFNMAELLAKVEERSPYIVVAFQECERMNVLTREIRRSLTELDLGLKVRGGGPGGKGHSQRTQPDAQRRGRGGAATCELESCPVAIRMPGTASLPETRVWLGCRGSKTEVL